MCAQSPAFPQRRIPAKRAFSGLAGSPLSVSREVQTQEKPKDPPKQLVLVHFCFDQERGEARAPRCTCKLRVSKQRAYELVDARQADFLRVKNPKTDELTKFHRAIVIRRMHVAGETLFAIAPPVKADRRDVRHEEIKNTLRLKARGVLQLLFAAKTVSAQQMQMPDSEIDTVFADPSKLDSFLSVIAGQKRLRKKWMSVALDWWSNALGYHRLSIDAGAFLVAADRGKGETVSGGYGSQKLGLVNGLRETNKGRVAVANHRASFWNGKWDYSNGANPNIDETDDERASRVESEHGQTV